MRYRKAIKSLRRYIARVGRAPEPESPAPKAPLAISDALVDVALEIAVEVEQEDQPRIARTYLARLPGHRVLKVKARFTMFGERDYYGELTQWDGKWVLFDPRRIADKILDPALVPVIQEYVNAITVFDNRFLQSSAARTFTDRMGHVWRRE